MDRRNLLQTMLGAAALAPGAAAKKAIKTPPAAPDYREMLRETFGPALSNLNNAGWCLVKFADFIDLAKPEEVETLSRMLFEWENCHGQIREGDFFKHVAATIAADGDTDNLMKWPQVKDAHAIIDAD